MSDPFRHTQGQVAWQSPSNIALVKYWGKHGQQLPRNASISFTLSQAHTEMQVAYRPKSEHTPGISMQFRFDGHEQPRFGQKIHKYLEEMIVHFPFLGHLHLDIESRNSFPHSAGIASSASAMSALALCLTDIENHTYGGMRPAEFLEKASMIARLGSGSACRSVYPWLAVWGKHPAVPLSSNEHAVPFIDAVDPVFKTFKDAILIVSSEEKSVSSRAGHALMENNPFASARYAQAGDNLGVLIEAMKAGDLEVFGNIVENEALTLHALMMSSHPSFILMQPNSLKIIDLIKTFRKENNIPLCYTLDAGPNIHLLYPEANAEAVETFIREVLLSYCENDRVIFDAAGDGPKKLS